MDDFGGWSMQYAAEPCLPSCPSDDDGLLGAFLGGGGGGFDLRSDHGGRLSLQPSSHPVQNFMPCHGGPGLSVSDGFMGLDTADMLANVTGALDDGGLLDTFAYGSDVIVAEEPAQPTASNNAFSGYSSTTGGNYGNISSGESNTCGGGGGCHDTEVASPTCALSRSAALPQAPAAPTSKRKLGKYPAIAASAATTSTEAQVAAPRRGAKRDTATSSSSTSITFAAGHGDHHAAGGASPSVGGGYEYEPDSEALAQVKEMIYRAAAMRPVHQLVCGAGSEPPPPPSSQSKPRRKNVRISSDPQTVAARLRRERVSERLRVLQRLVPGGSRMDTASMLDEAASYLKFLKSQVKALERASPSNGGYHNGSLLPQSYTAGSPGVGGGGGGTGVAFGRDGAIGGYVKSNRNMHL